MTEIREWGFEVHRGILPAETVEAAAETLGSLTSRTRAGARHLMGHPLVEALANDPGLLALAARGLGGEALPFRATLFDKSPAANWLVAWHQDTALPVCARRDLPGWGPWSLKAGVLYAHAPAAALESVVALRVHLDDSLPENGPLRVLPGTHAQGVLSDEAIRDLASRVCPQDATCPRGGVIVMRPLLVHASSKSATPAPRRVLHIEYARTRRLGDGIELAIA